MRFVTSIVAAFAMLSLLTPEAVAHAILVRSTPKPHDVVASGELNVSLEFNSRIDGARSSLTLISPGGKTETLVLLPQPSPASLAAKTSRLDAGSYSIRWQVLANDGHISRGEIPFGVK